MAVFGTSLSPGTGESPLTPLPLSMAGVTCSIDGVPAAFYYASPTQLNIQIPYETVAGGTSFLTVMSFNGTMATISFRVQAAAPGIFTFEGGAPVPFTTAKRGDIIFLFITGAGAVTPAIADGASPSLSTPVTSLPAPTGKVTLSVGGVNANVLFDGIPYFLVGVMQINYVVPSNAPLGMQPVVVSIGSFSSVPVMLNVTD